jgi:hypothetical protein
MADAIELVQPLLSQKMSITEEDIIKISKAVKAEILADIFVFVFVQVKFLRNSPNLYNMEMMNF